MNAAVPKVTFGMIVLNGLPFLPHNLRSLYPFAHEIIVVEGAAPGAAGVAGPAGHSRDGTLDELRRFIRDDDPEGKVTVVTAEDEGHVDGFWAGEKDEQSRAYARRATGEYLWQVDVDEFYLPGDMQRVFAMLAADSAISAVTFPTVTIWGDLGVAADGWYLRRGGGLYHRLFKWAPGYEYATHRPPTVVDERGRDLRTLRWLSGREMARHGVVMRHYSLLLPKQVRQKVEYYTSWGLYEDRFVEARRWLDESYLALRRPYRVHNVYQSPSWLQRFRGSHPPEITTMIAELRRSDPGALRPMADAERLLGSPRYSAGRGLLKALDTPALWSQKARRWAGRVVGRTRARRQVGRVRP